MSRRRKWVLVVILALLMGMALLAAHALAARPLTQQIQVKAAYNDSQMVFQFQWASDEGKYHDYYVYEAGEWKKMGGPWPYTEAANTSYEDRLTFNMDDGQVTGFPQYGCFVTCHDDMRYMPQSPADEGDLEITKYILDTGKRLDLWHWRAHRSNPTGYSDDQWVTNKDMTKEKDRGGRHGDAGTGPYSTNWDKEKSQPKFMFDASKADYAAFKWDDLATVPYYYLSEEIAVPFDPALPWADGDTIPRRLLAVPTESRGDITANGVWKDGMWTVELTRKLDSGHPEDDVILQEGGLYHVAFALHKDKTGNRHHYVSFPLSLGLGVDANIQAVKFTGDAPDWASINATTVAVFLPGQTSWEFVTSDQHPGSATVQEGQVGCAGCHEASFVAERSTAKDPALAAPAALPETGEVPLSRIYPALMLTGLLSLGLGLALLASQKVRRGRL